MGDVLVEVLETDAPASPMRKVLVQVVDRGTLRRRWFESLRAAELYIARAYTDVDAAQCCKEAKPLPPKWRQGVPTDVDEPPERRRNRGRTES